MQRRIAVVGLGYVGMPVAAAFARAYPGTIAFDIDRERIESLRRGHDSTGEMPDAALADLDWSLSADPAALADAQVYVVAVPTPVDAAKRPDLGPLRAANATVGAQLKRGDVVVYESTVYPGLTRELCGPQLEAASGLRCGEDFFLGYSPERINPGDPQHGLEGVVKVVGAQDEATLELLCELYGRIVPAGVHRASSIEVAEASKVIENVQRDLNIALMNECAVIFERLGISTHEVLAAAGTKWNFLRFFPGLVGGHCIGVDPYYLTMRAQEVGINPQVILAGRRINDSMGEFVARQTIKRMCAAGLSVSQCRIAVLGLTFKENVRDVRNSMVPQIVAELAAHGARVQVCDPVADAAAAKRAYGIELVDAEALAGAQALVCAVPHAAFGELAAQLARPPLRVAVDVRGMLDADKLPDEIEYWRL